MYGTTSYGTTPYGADPTSGGINHTVAVTATANSTTPLALLQTAMLYGNVKATSPLVSKAAYHLALSDHGNATTTMHVVWNMLLTSTSNATTTLGFTASAIQNIVDTLLATGQCTSVLAAKNAIVEAIFVAGNLNRAMPVSISDTANAHDTMQSMLVTTMLLIDDAVAHTTLGTHVNMTIAVPDGVHVTSLIAHLLAAHQHVTDTVIAALSFQLDGDVYSAVVLNTESKGVSEYLGYNFNSFGQFNGGYFGCADDGIYLLQGDDDNGTPIDSFIRTGLMQIAQGKKARCPEVFFGLTTTGDMLLRVVTTHPSGSKEENFYRLEKRTADAPRSTRAKIGRGLSSVYFGYTLESIDGSQWALDTMRVLVMALERLI